MHGRFWRSVSTFLVVILVLAGIPSTLLAAPAPKMDPGDREAAAQAVAQVGAVLQGGGMGVAKAPGGAKAPLSGEMVTHTAAGVSLTASTDWEVTDGDGDIFEIGLPGEFVFGFLSEESADEFPGVFAIIFFEQQSDFLAASMGEDVALQDVFRFETDQGLPGLVIRLGGDISGLDMTGSMYMVAAGDATYMLMILADNDTWDEIQPAADAIAASIVAENPSIMVSGGADGLAYTTVDGTTSLMLPPNWQIQELTDENIPLILVNPEMTFVAIGLWQPLDEFNDESDLALYNALLSAVAGSEQEAGVLALLLKSMDMGSGDDDEMAVDEAATALITTTDPPTLRLGATITNDEMDMPLMAYVQARDEGLVGLIAMGNLDNVLDAEETILEIMESVMLGSGK